MEQHPISVITTVYNEGESIERFLASVAQQTRTPDEFVIVDGGSTDDTVERLRLAAASDSRIKVIVEAGNRSHGRNTAIKHATHDIVACTDGGCTVDTRWLEHISTPFESGASWVAGFYRVEAPSVLDRCVGLTIVYVIEEVDADLFLPSGRSMAMTKSAWELSGGFPEHAEFGEDTLFDEQMLAAGFRPVFAPEATVGWTPPSGFGGLARTTFQWGRGDGAAGLRGPYYKRTLAAYAAAVALGVLLAATKPRTLPLLAVPIVIAIWKSIRFKLRHETSPLKYVYLPVARVTATTSNLAGYLVGRYIGE
jgi:cellulose synthase/poly-beta-1,6-N-acetylglucosamine synthase-like glycosyltransferase